MCVRVYARVCIVLFAFVFLSCKIFLVNFFFACMCVLQRCDERSVPEHCRAHDESRRGVQTAARVSVVGDLRARVARTLARQLAALLVHAADLLHVGPVSLADQRRLHLRSDWLGLAVQLSAVCRPARRINLRGAAGFFCVSLFLFVVFVVLLFC